MKPLSSQSNAEAVERCMVSLRLTAEARAILAHLAQSQGISQSAVLEVLLREAVVREPARHR